LAETRTRTSCKLFAGKVKAVGGNSQLIEGYERREKKAFRVLWSSDGYHDLALMASSKVPEKDMKAVAAAFNGMVSRPQRPGDHCTRLRSKRRSERRRLLHSGHGTADYASYRKFYQTAPTSLR
jgi:phosphonate transport system substrate-binding protein